MVQKNKHRCFGRLVANSLMVILVVLVVSLLFSGSAFAQREPYNDIPGSKDHPMISRYAGSVIVGYETKEYDEFVLPLGGIILDDGEVRPIKSQKIEGKITRILYLAPKGRSTLEILRNYEAELRQAGFQVLFNCAGNAGCGERGDLLHQFIYSRERKLKELTSAFNFPKDQRYLAAKLTRPEGDVYVSVYMAVNNFDIPKWLDQRITVLLEVIETKPMEAGMVTVTVDAFAMAKDIANTGRVALYGIYFDTDKAEIKPESKPTLDEIAKLLRLNPTLRLYVVGHTDATGTLEYNMELSRRRAEAVVNTLVFYYGIDPKRLKAFGVGPLAPVATNDTEEGRAKNRRVELVKQ